MRKLAITITGIFALTLATAGCKQETADARACSTGADDCGRADAAGQHCNRGQCRTPIHDEYWVPRAGPSHLAPRQCRRLG